MMGNERVYVGGAARDHLDGRARAMILATHIEYLDLFAAQSVDAKAYSIELRDPDNKQLAAGLQDFYRLIQRLLLSGTLKSAV